MYDQRIAGPRAFYIKGSRQRITARSPANSVLVDTSGVNALRLDSVAWEDMQRRRDVPGEIVVEGGRLEFMRLRAAGRRHERTLADEGEGPLQVGAFSLEFVAIHGELRFPGLGVTVLSYSAYTDVVVLRTLDA